MTPIHNGPARNAKGRQRRVLTADRDPSTCHCPNGRPIPVATFRKQQLVDIELLHLRAAGCVLPTVHVPPRTWLTGAAH